MTADLLTRVTDADAPDDALTERQALALQRGVTAALENSDDDQRLGLPSEHLTERCWDHAGVGISVYIHRKSGVVIFNTDGKALVTDVDTIDNMSLASARFHATTGGFARINNDFAEREVDQ